MRCRNSSRSLQEELKGSSASTSSKSEVTTAPSSATTMLIHGVMKKASSTSSPPHTHLNKTESLRGRTRHSSPWQGQCWTTTARRRIFGRKQSTRLAMRPTASIYIAYLARPHMSSSFGENPISSTFGSLDASASSTRRKGSVNLKRDVILVSLLVMHQTPRPTVYSTKPLVC